MPDMNPDGAVLQVCTGSQKVNNMSTPSEMSQSAAPRRLKGVRLKTPQLQPETGLTLEL